MPNHVHGIIIFDKPIGAGNDGCPDDRMAVGTPNLGVPTTADQNHENPDNPKSRAPNLGVPTGGKNNKWKPGILGVVINQYKRACTINKNPMRTLKFQID